MWHSGDRLLLPSCNDKAILGKSPPHRENPVKSREVRLVSAILGPVYRKDMWKRPLEERMTTQRTQRLEAKPVQQGQGHCAVAEASGSWRKARADRRATVSTQLLMQMAARSVG